MTATPGQPPIHPSPPPPQQAAAPARSGLPAALRSWPRTFARLYRSEPGVWGEAGQQSGSLPLFWVVAVVIHGAVIGVSLDLFVARIASEIYYGPKPSLGVYVGAFLLPVALTTVYVLTRTGTLVALFRLRGRRVRFDQAANIAALGYVAAFPVAATLLLFSILPGEFTGLLVCVAGVAACFLGEASVYVTVAKTGRFDRSITGPYAWLTTGWIIVTTVVVALVARDLIANWLASYLPSPFWW